MVPPDEAREGVAIRSSRSKAQQGFVYAGTDSAEGVPKYSPQMDNEGKALGQAPVNGLRRSKCFHRSYHTNSYRSLLDASQREGSAGMTNRRNLAANCCV